MKPYERLRESPSPTGDNTISKFPDENYLAVGGGGMFFLINFFFTGPCFADDMVFCTGAGGTTF
jgi:hypothetical protein